MSLSHIWLSDKLRCTQKYMQTWFARQTISNIECCLVMFLHLCLYIYQHWTNVHISNSPNPAVMCKYYIEVHCRSHFPQIRSMFMMQTLTKRIKKMIGEKGNLLEFHHKKNKTLLTTNNTKVHLTFAKEILITPNTLEKTICGLTRQKFNIFGRSSSCCIWMQTKSFTKKEHH